MNETELEIAITKNEKEIKHLEKTIEDKKKELMELKRRLRNIYDESHGKIFYE